MMLYRNEGIKRDTGHTVQQWSRIFSCFLIYFGLCAAAATLMGHTQHTITRTEKEKKGRKKIKESKAIHHRPKGGREYGIFGRRAQQKPKPRVVFLVSFSFISAAPLSSTGSRGASAPFRCATHEMERLEHRLSLILYFFCFVILPPRYFSFFFFFRLIIYFFVLFCLLTPVLCR